MQVPVRHARGQEEQRRGPLLQLNDPHFDVEGVQHHLATIGIFPEDDRLIGAACHHVARILTHERCEFDARHRATMPRKGLPQARWMLRVENVPQLDCPVRRPAVQKLCLWLHFQRSDGALVHVSAVSQLVMGGGRQHRLRAPVLVPI